MSSRKHTPSRAWRIEQGQNFLNNQRLATQLVSESSIDSGDTVIEIGAGPGGFTAALSHVAREVIAIEKDLSLVSTLQRRFRDVINVRVVPADFLGYRLPITTYKVFSNIPFNLTAAVIRRLLFDRNPPADCYLVMQREAAMRYRGTDRDSMLSILLKPFFVLSIEHTFERSDFTPLPSVDVVLLRARLREEPLVGDRGYYDRFVRAGFQASKASLVKAYRDVFTYRQWKRLARTFGFALKAVPTELGVEQWIGIYEFFRTHVAEEKRLNVAREGTRG